MYNPQTILDYSWFPVGRKVKIIAKGVDFYFFYGETGTVIKNNGSYLGIIVEFDKPRYFKDGEIQKIFNFNPHDLIPVKLTNIFVKCARALVNMTILRVSGVVRNTGKTLKNFVKLQKKLDK